MDFYIHFVATLRDASMYITFVKKKRKTCEIRLLFLFIYFYYFQQQQK